MSERRWNVSEAAVISATEAILEADGSGVLATIVDVEGNAYRRPGSKMLVDADGEGFGHITAGCLEDEVREIAASVLASGGPRIETYDLMDDDIWGLGLGCNGIIDVLLEPIGAHHRPLIRARGRGRPIASATVIGGDPPMGSKAYYDGSGMQTVDDGFPTWLRKAIEPSIEAAFSNAASDTVTIETDEGYATVFLDGMHPPLRLLVCGSGNDVGPVVELAERNDFDVTVAGFRGGIDLADRFPQATDHVSSRASEIDQAVDLDDRTYAVIMTHNFVDDRLVLERLLDSPVAYIGLMGPRSRFEEMLEAFEAEETSLPESAFERVYTPIGIDLGSGSPYGIATSIIAEILAVANGRTPRHLTEREGPIHDRVDLDSSASE